MAGACAQRGRAAVIGTEWSADHMRPSVPPLNLATADGQIGSQGNLGSSLERDMAQILDDEDSDDSDDDDNLSEDMPDIPPTALSQDQLSSLMVFVAIQDWFVCRIVI